ncbi:hypothetical protein D3C81_2274590 [compost metagenome]
MRRPPLTGELAGNQAQAAGGIGQLDLRDVGCQQRLVGRRSQLVAGRQVDPQLHHFQGAAGARKRLGVKLLMEDA